MKYIKLFETQEYPRFKLGEIIYKKSELWDIPNFWRPTGAEFNINADKYRVFAVVGILGKVINVQNLKNGAIEKNILTSQFISQEEYSKKIEDYKEFLIGQEAKKYNL